MGLAEPRSRWVGGGVRRACPADEGIGAGRWQEVAGGGSRR